MVASARPWARRPPPSGMLADLLDVDEHQLAGPVAFVAHRGGLGGADHLTCDRIQQPQVRHVVAAQDACHGPGRHAQFGSEPVLPTPMFSSQRSAIAASIAALVRRGLDLAVRSGRPARPHPRRRTWPPTDARIDARSPSPSRRWPPAHPCRRTRSTNRRRPRTIETGVSVGHENLRVGAGLRQSTPHPEVLLVVNAYVSPTSWPSTSSR